MQEFINLIWTVDPQAVKYDSMGEKGGSYTVFSPYRVKPLYASGGVSESTAFVQVDYFTQKDNDPKAAAFFDAFISDDNVTVSYHIDFENDTRYIHHIFDCEVICRGAV